LLTAQIELIAVTPQGSLSLLVIPAKAGIQLFLNLGEDTGSRLSPG